MYNCTSIARQRNLKVFDIDFVHESYMNNKMQFACCSLLFCSFTQHKIGDHAVYFFLFFFLVDYLFCKEYVYH